VKDVPLEKPDTGFYLDGCFHGMLVLKALPKRTRPSIAYLLTKLGFREYAISVNVESVDVDQLIDKEQKELNRVEGDYESLRKGKAPRGDTDQGGEDRALLQWRQFTVSDPIRHPCMGSEPG
jgi:hypothetical protein